MTSTQHTHDIDRALPQQRARAAVPPAGFAELVPPGLVQLPPRPARRDVLAIKASLTAVRREPVALAQCFYAHLFEMAPAVRTMFAGDMTAQMQRMTDVLLATIAALENEAPALENHLRGLGALHRDRWNVRPEHYLYIAHALTRAVRDVAGPAWSGSLSSSWIALTQWITGHMLVGHHGGATAAPPSPA
jgi:hemoglobin-like flavoprotein